MRSLEHRSVYPPTAAADPGRLDAYGLGDLATVFKPFGVLAWIAVVAIGGAACSAPSTGRREPDEYLGCGTDESWRTFDDQAAGGLVKTDDAQALKLVMPAPGAALPASPKPTFSWQPTATVVGQRNGDASCVQCPTCGTLGTQHQPPVSGDDYDLQFAVGGKVVWRVITTLQFWTPPDALWAGWKGQTVSLAPVRVTLKVNDVQDGPFQPAKPFTFTVGN